MRGPSIGETPVPEALGPVRFHVTEAGAAAPRHLLIVSHVLVQSAPGGEAYLHGGVRPAPGRVRGSRSERVTILTCAKDVSAAPDDYRLEGATTSRSRRLPPFMSPAVSLAADTSGMIRTAAESPQYLKIPVPHAERPMCSIPVSRPPSAPSGSVYSRFFSEGRVVYYMAGDWVARRSEPSSTPVATMAWRRILGSLPIGGWSSNGRCFTAGEAVAESLHAVARRSR